MWRHQTFSIISLMHSLPTLRLHLHHHCFSCTLRRVCFSNAQLFQTLVLSCWKYWSRCWISYMQRCRSLWSWILSASNRLTASSTLLWPAKTTVSCLKKNEMKAWTTILFYKNETCLKTDYKSPWQAACPSSLCQTYITENPLVS